MTITRYAARTALAFSTILTVLPPAAAHAEESLLIWAPAKIADYAYRVRMGAKTASAPVSAGVDLSLTTSSTGRIRDTRDNARLWAELRGQGDVQRNVTAAYNPMTGRISAAAGVTRRIIATDTIDVVLAPSVQADANRYHGYNGSVRVTQKARIESVRTGTAFVASGTALKGTRGLGTEVGVEQKLFDKLDVGASIRREDSATVGALKARFSFNW